MRLSGYWEQAEVLRHVARGHLLSLFIRVHFGDVIYKKRPTRNLSPAGLSLCKFCKPRYRLTSTAARASSADVPF